MSQAIWSYVEARTDIRRVDPTTWPQGAPGGVSYKKLKRNASFRAVLESASTRSALDGIFDPDDASDRGAFLTQPHVVDGQPLELRELGGDPGDVHVCHINLFHSVAPNASPQPRMMVTHAIRLAASTPERDSATG